MRSQTPATRAREPPAPRTPLHTMEQAQPQGNTTMVSHPNQPLPSIPEPHPQQNILNMTLADLLAGLQRPFQVQPQIVPAPCALGNNQPPQLAFCAPVAGQPPSLAQSGVKGGLGQPPPLPQLIQQNCRPVGQPPPLPHQGFGRLGRLTFGQP